MHNVFDERPTALPHPKPSLKSRMSLSISNALRFRRRCLGAEGSNLQPKLKVG